MQSAYVGLHAAVHEPEGTPAQIGLSEASVLRDYHEDAEARYNVTCDFAGVIRELRDPHKRFPFQVLRGAPHPGAFHAENSPQKMRGECPAL